MYKEPVIAIFDITLRITGFVLVSDKVKFEETIFCFENQKVKIEEFIATLNSQKLRLKKEIVSIDGVSIGLEELTNEAETVTAVAEEFKISGYIVKIIPSNLKDILIFISSKYTLEQREKILGDLTNLPIDTSDESIKEIQDILIQAEIELLIKQD